MSLEATPVKFAPRRTPVEAVPECLRNRAPPPRRNACAAESDMAWPVVGSAARSRRSRTPALALRCGGKTAMAVVCAGARSDKVNGGFVKKK